MAASTRRTRSTRGPTTPFGEACSFEASLPPPDVVLGTGPAAQALAREGKQPAGRRYRIMQG